MLKKLLIILGCVVLAGCVTTQIQYVDKIVYVPVKVDDSLFKLDPVPQPPGKEEFVKKPKNKDEVIMLLRSQRDMPVDYAEDLLQDTAMCRVRLTSIQELQQKQVENILKGNQQ